MRKLKLLLATCALVLGWSSANAQTDVTNTYLVNPSFETLKTSDGTTDVTVKTTLSSGLHGWVVPSMSNYQVESSASGSSSGFVNGGSITPSDGTYYYFNRQGWSNLNTELKTTTKAAVAPGNYYLVFDYKAADYSNNNNASNNGTTIGITVKDASSNTIATLPAAKIAYSITNGGSNPGSDTYLKDAPWSKKGVAFTVTTSSVLTFAIQQNMKNSGRSDIVYDNFKLYKIDDASDVDFTGYIANPGFEANNTNGWTGTNDGGDPAFAHGNKQQWNGSFNFSQEVQALPNGKYRLTVQGFYRPGGNGAELSAQNAKLFAGEANSPLQYVSSEAKAEKDDANGFTTAYGDLGFVPNSQSDAKKAFESGAYDDNELLFYVTTNNITIGTKKEVKVGSDWTVFDNFKLYLKALAIENYAETYTAVTSVTADKWYVCDISANGDYRFISDVANTITYTQTGTYINEDVSTSETLTADTKKVLALTTGKLYFKVSADATLTIEPDTYTYSVGDATPSIDDGSYTQSLTTISFAINASSNDPDATFAILNNTATATLSAGGSPVANGTLSLSGTTLTATFSELSLTQNTTYTIAIAADVVGYAGHATNAAISTTFKTGIIADGEYYFQKKNAQAYISRGGDWGTRAVVSDLGISFDVSLLPNGKYNLKNHDWSLAANANKYLGYTTDIFVDRGVDSYTIEAADGGYVLRTNDNKYLKATTNSSNDIPYDYLDVTETAGDAIIWVPISKATYNSNLAALRNAEASAIATSAGKSASTVAGLASILASDYGTTDVTSSILNAECTANLDNWTQVKYAVGNKDFDANGTTGEVWDGFGGIKQEITGLAEGIYKVSVHATWRPGDAASGNRAGNDINTNAWVYANTATSSNLTQLKSWYAGGASINSRADMLASGDTYLNEVFVYVSEGETLTIGIASPSKCNGAWLPFYGWSLTYYEEKSTAAEKTALAEAITAAEAKTLGFENGEYAPYNNVDALTKLATAKAIDPDVASSNSVVTATTALTGATWTANTVELNAVNNGNFATNNAAETGWTFSAWGEFVSGLNTNTGASNGTARSSNQGTLTYGNLTGFTMPLKANTYYQLTFKVASWDNDNKNTGTDVSILNSSNEGLTLKSFGASTSNRDSYGAFTDYKAIFKTGAAGNYTLVISAKGNRSVYTDIVLKKAVLEDVTIAENNASDLFYQYADVTIERGFNAGWNAVCLPFNTAAFNGAEIAEFSGEEGTENVTLQFTKATSFEANKPYLVYFPAAVAANKVFEGVVVDPATVKTTGTAFDFEGTYKVKAIEAGNWVVSGGALKKASAEINLKPTRTYFTPKSSTARIAGFTIDGEEVTGLKAVMAEQGARVDGIYNLQGQKVDTVVRKGIYVVNGKKVIK